MNTYFIPSSLCMRMNPITCDYCRAEGARSIKTNDRLFGIRACEAHVSLAERDIKAFYYEEKVVKLCDFLAHFPAVAEMTDIVVTRSDGSVRTDAKVFTESNNMVLQWNDKVETWVITVEFEDKVEGQMIKQVPVSALRDPEILVALEQGFYLEEWKAHCAAVAAAAAKADASATVAAAAAAFALSAH